MNPDNPVEVVRAVSGELDRMQTLVNKEVRWLCYTFHHFFFKRYEQGRQLMRALADNEVVKAAKSATAAAEAAGR